MDPGSTETLLVCIGPSAPSARVVTDSGKMAAALGARWIAASVETSRTRALDEGERDALMKTVWLAEQLGAETVRISGHDVAGQILDYARSQGVTRIVMGTSRQRRWTFFRGDKIAHRLLRASGDIDVYLIRGAGRPERSFSSAGWCWPRWGGYVGAIGIVVAASLLALGFQEAGLSEANTAIVFIPAVMGAAMWWGLGAGLLAAVMSVMSFDFLIVPPSFEFAFRDIEYVITLLVLAAVAVLVGTLAARLRRQVSTSIRRERRLEVLYRLSRGLSGVSGARPLSEAAARELANVFGGKVTVYLPGPDGVLEPVNENKGDSSPDDAAASAWAFKHGQLAGKGTEMFTEAVALHLPVVTAQGTLGTLAVESPSEEVLLSPGDRQLLETAATHLGLAIERDVLAELSRKAALEAETERMRSSLLSSASHDLRTPLAVIAGTTSTLLELEEGANPETRRMLLGEVYEESDRLGRLVENLLAMTRLDAGVIAVDKQWFPLEDVIGSTLRRLRKESRGRVVNKHLPSDLPLVLLDGVMIEQVLFNLLDNALKYSPSDGPVDIRVSSTEGTLTVEVADQGPGLAEEEMKVVFDKLHRGSASVGRARGAGLGLAIARAIVHAHGGDIWAANRPEGGAVFAFTLPLEPAPADLELDDDSDIEEEG
jgi:two-component system sensor histidine kinase KdpD